MKTSNITRLAEDAAGKLQVLVERLKGWNLLAGLYAEGESCEEDLILAYVERCRVVLLNAMRLTHAQGLAALRGSTRKYEALERRLAQHSKREAKLAYLCREAIKAHAGKEQGQ